MGITSINREDLDALSRAIAEINSRNKQAAPGNTAGSNAANRDTISLVGFKESPFEEWRLSQQGADVRITFPDGKSILLRDRQISDLSADQFQFGDKSFIPPALHRRTTRSVTEPAANIRAEYTAIEAVFIPPVLHRRSPRSVTEFASDLGAERTAIGQERSRNLAFAPSTQGSSASDQEAGKPLDNLPSISFAFASPRMTRAAATPVMSSMNPPTRMASVGAPVATAPNQRAEHLVQAMAAFAPASAGTVEFAPAERQPLDFAFAASSQ
jgi:hypothetical protein